MKKLTLEQVELVNNEIGEARARSRAASTLTTMYPWIYVWPHGAVTLDGDFYVRDLEEIVRVMKAHGMGDASDDDPAT